MKIRITEKKPSTIPANCPTVQVSSYLDQWIPLTMLEQMQQTEYDALIVGSGAGGGAVLWRLCDRWKHSGKRIAMLEAGGLLLSTNARNISTLDGNRLNEYITNPKISVPMNFPEFPAAVEVNALGGRTLTWDANSPRTYTSVLRNWPVTVNELEPYFNIAEQAMQVTKSYSENAPATQILLNRLWQNGFPNASAMPRAMNLNPVHNKSIRSDVFFSSILFLAQALNQYSFDLAVNARVTKILTDKGKVTGVEVRSQEQQSYIIRAKRVILSGSTFETPRLLLHSGITGKAVGHYLLDQLAVRTTISVRRSAFPLELGPLWILVPQADDFPYQFMISNAETYDSVQELAVLVRGYAAIEPRFENKVSLDPYRRDEYGVPKLKVRFSYSTRDEAVLNSLIQMTKRVVKTLGADSTLEDICLRPPGDPHHESGTCRMGTNPELSATDKFGQIHGISGLFVADNSVFPSIGAANPTLTMVALAIRTADYIANQIIK